MATETGDSTTGDSVSPYIRGVTVTTISTLSGIAAGVLSAMYAGGPEDSLGFFILAVAILAQLPLIQGLGIDVREFDTKDKLYVGFMTTVLWFISWSILLTVQAL